MFARAHVTPANPRTALQVAARRALADATRAYAQLSPEHKQSWEITAADHTRVDPDGAEYRPGPMALFISVNWYRLQAGQAIVPVAPPLGGPVTDLSEPGVTLHGDATTFALHSAAANGIVLLEATGPLPGTRRPKKNEHRMVNATNPAANFLPAKEGSLTLTVAGPNCRHTFKPGDRLALRATLLTADYVRQTVQTFQTHAV